MSILCQIIFIVNSSATVHFFIRFPLLLLLNASATFAAFIYPVHLSEPVRTLLEHENRNQFDILFRSILLYTWLNRDAYNALLVSFEFPSSIERNACSIRYTDFFKV